MATDQLQPAASSHRTQEEPKKGGLTRRQFMGTVAVSVLAGSLRPLSAQSSSTGMTYRVLGKTGIRTSAIGFGSHLTDANVADTAARTAQIRAGIDQGITLFDIYDHTFHQFGLMSQVLEPVRQDVLLSLVTVWAKEKVMAEVNYALTTFKTDYIDLYRIYMDGSTPRADVATRFAALQQAKQAGKVRAVGLVTHDHAVVSEMLSTYPDLDYVMLPYNFQYQRFSPSTVVRPSSWGEAKQSLAQPSSAAPLPQLIPGAGKAQVDCMYSPCEDSELLGLVRDTGAGVIAIKPFAAGGLLQLAPADPLLAQLKDAGVGLPQAALRFVLQNEDIACALPAMNSLQEVAENTAAGDGDGLSSAEVRLLQLYADAAEQARGAHLPQGYGWLEQWKA